MAEYITYSGSVCNINYHFVWVTKYRKPILTFVEDAKQVLQSICDQNGWLILAIEIMPDHIHLFITTPPFYAPSKIVKILKGTSARLLFQKHSELRTELWEGHLWSPSYYCGTAGNVSAAVIKSYIEQQKTQKPNSSTD